MNCNIASPGLIPKVTCSMSLWVFPTEKNVPKSSLVHFGDNPNTKIRLSSNGPSTTGSDLDGLISFTSIRLPSKVSPFLLCNSTRSYKERKML